MGRCCSGMDLPTLGGEISIFISSSHPLVRLGNAIPWDQLLDIIALDLALSVRPGYWFVGRKLKLRIHLGAYLLQHMFNMTYRQVEREIRDNAAYQVFCGRTTVDQWHVPDHTRIFQFQRRLRPITQQKLANAIACLAYKYGFANPSWMDIDSTIQEANIRRSSEIYLMERLASYAYRLKKHLWKYVPENYAPLLGAPLNIKNIHYQAKNYFLYGKSLAEVKASALEEMKKDILPIMLSLFTFIFLLKKKAITIPSNLARYLKLIDLNFIPLLQNVNHFQKHHWGQQGRILSLHLQEVAIFAKGMPGRLKVKYGRQWQVGRIGGNFLIVGESNGPRTDDHESVQPMIKLHQQLFGKYVLESFGTDRGYYSENNRSTLVELQKEMKEGEEKDFVFSLPKPRTRDWQLSEQALILYRRRSGVEALIGHAKAKGQLKRTRATTDLGTKNSGYTSVLGFNLRQMTRYLMLRD